MQTQKIQKLLQPYKDKIYKGIYSINFDNGKRYIGMSVNIYERLKEHINDAKNRNDLLPVHLAMNKYSYKFELLENCYNMNRTELCNREIYWIDYYQTYKDKTKGYNLTPGGDGMAFGCNNLQAKLNEQQIQEVYFRLKNELNTYIYQIAADYNLSPEAMSEINNGKRYYNEFLNYPLRNIHWMPIPECGIKNANATIQSEEEYANLVNDLKHSQLTFEQIEKKYNICYATLSKINQGHTYYHENIKYPIRPSKQRRCYKLSFNDMHKICELLIHTNNTIKSISEQFKVSRDVVYRLEKGINYSFPEYKYPLRANIKFNQAVSTISESGEQRYY